MEQRQLVLPVSWSFSQKRSDFIVSDCNRYAFEWLEKWPFQVRDNFVCLVGGPGSGKTHLAKMWASRLGAEFFHTKEEDIFDKWYEISSNAESQKYFVIDDADRISDDILLFYIYNTIKEKDAFILFTAKLPPMKWNLKLEDIKSRISTVNVLRIQQPGEMAFHQILDKMLLQRGIKVSEEVLDYIANRIERSYDSMIYWVNKLDKQIVNKTKPSLANIRKIIT